MNEVSGLTSDTIRNYPEHISQIKLEHTQHHLCKLYSHALLRSVHSLLQDVGLLDDEEGGDRAAWKNVSIGCKLFEGGEETAGVIFAEEGGLNGIKAAAGAKDAFVSAEIGEEVFGGRGKFSGGSGLGGDHAKGVKTGRLTGCGGTMTKGESGGGGGREDKGTGERSGGDEGHCLKKSACKGRGVRSEERGRRRE